MEIEMKYILVAIPDEKWDRTTLPKVVAALNKFKPSHVQTVVFHGKALVEEVTNNDTK
jgi:hypothetical protein